MMQLNWDSHPNFLVSLVACAIGGTASAAVVLCLLDFPMIPGVPPISSGAIVRNASAFQETGTPRNRPVVETARLVAIAMISPADRAVAKNSPVLETPMRLVAIGASDELATQMKAEHRSEVHSQELHKHARSAIREHHQRRRFTHSLSSSPRPSLW
jgi:hypothetical protein